MSIEKKFDDDSPIDIEPSRSYDLDTRRRAALAEIDNASFSRFHVKTVIVAGIGFFTDAYDIFVVSICATMIGYAFNSATHNGKLTSNQDLGIKIATPVGTFVGQLLFGWLADVFGRKRMYGLELVVIIIGTIGQAVAGQSHAINIIGVLIFWRFFMGVGIGGDYPLSAVLTSEFAATRIRGRMMTAVFAFQGWGQFSAAIISTIVVSAYKSKFLNDPVGNPETADLTWRWLVGLGVVPAVVALYFRLTISETPRFQMDVERNVAEASKQAEHLIKTGEFNPVFDSTGNVVAAKPVVPKASRRDFFKHFGKWENGKVLFGTAWSWFALDIAFYGLGQNSSLILQQIGYGGTPTGTPQEIIWKTLHNVSIGNIILSVAGLIPGYWVTFLFIDKWGRKPIQLQSFVMLTIFFCIMGFGYHKLTGSSSGRSAFVAIYCLTNFWQNFGANTTTFVIPGEVFPTRYRSTAHGISAASGKLGAIVAQIIIFTAKDKGGAPGSNHFLNHILQIFAAFMLTGIFSTLLIPETKGKSLEELSGEDQTNFISQN